MFLIPSKPWPEVVEFYRSLAETHPSFRHMAALVEEIAASNYARGLYASTSMTTLLISQTEEIDMEKEILSIKLDSAKGVVILDFQETFSKLPKYQHWIRKCPPEEGFARLVGFLQLKGWFVA